MSDPIIQDVGLFEDAARRLSERPGFMAHTFATALSAEFTAARVAQELACAPETAIRVALMRTPRTDRDGLRADVSRIAETAGIDAVRLIGIVRQAQTVAAFATVQSSDEGALLAARDSLPKNRGEEC